MRTLLFPGVGTLVLQPRDRDSRPRSPRIPARSSCPGLPTGRPAPMPDLPDNGGTRHKVPLRRDCGRFRCRSTKPPAGCSTQRRLPVKARWSWERERWPSRVVRPRRSTTPSRTGAALAHLEPLSCAALARWRQAARS